MELRHFLQVFIKLCDDFFLDRTVLLAVCRIILQLEFTTSVVAIRFCCFTHWILLFYIYLHMRLYN
jgi:hypothetical protein